MVWGITSGGVAGSAVARGGGVCSIARCRSFRLLEVAGCGGGQGFRSFGWLRWQVDKWIWRMLAEIRMSV